MTLFGGYVYYNIDTRKILISFIRNGVFFRIIISIPHSSDDTQQYNICISRAIIICIQDSLTLYYTLFTRTHIILFILLLHCIYYMFSIFKKKKPLRVQDIKDIRISSLSLLLDFFLHSVGTPCTSWRLGVTHQQRDAGATCVVIIAMDTSDCVQSFVKRRGSVFMFFNHEYY